MFLECVSASEVGWVNSVCVCGRCLVCLAAVAIWVEVLTTPLSEAGLQCGRDLRLVVACAVFFVYQDDTLIVGMRRFVCKAVRRAKHTLQRVGFIISPKSVTEPSRSLDFLGKVFDLSSGTLENCPGMLRGWCVGAFVAVAGVMVAKSERHGEILGWLEWALRLSASVSSRGVLLEARRGQSGSTCNAETPADCHLFCFCATAIYGEGQGASGAPCLLE